MANRTLSLRMTLYDQKKGCVAWKVLNGSDSGSDFNFPTARAPVPITRKMVQLRWPRLWVQVLRFWEFLKGSGADPRPGSH